MSMTAVPISIVRVRAPTAARSGNGEPSWRAKWCTRKYAPSAPSSSAATASSIDWSSASDAVRTSEWGDGVQCPNDRNPIFFIYLRVYSKSASGLNQMKHDGQPAHQPLGHRAERLVGGQVRPGRTALPRF